MHWTPRRVFSSDFFKQIKTLKGSFSFLLPSLPPKGKRGGGKLMLDTTQHKTYLSLSRGVK